MKCVFLLGALMGLALAVQAPSDSDNWVTEGGPTVRGLTCSSVLDAEEDFADQVQGAAKVVGGKRSGPYSVFQTNGDGIPTSLKDDRRGGREVKMDKVQQVILRSVCLDGYSVGVEVGRRLAAKEAAEKKAREDESDYGPLANCIAKYYHFWLATICLGLILGALTLVVVVAIFKNEYLANLLMEYYRRRGVGVRDSPQQMVPVALKKVKKGKKKSEPKSEVDPEKAAAELLSAATAVASGVRVPKKVQAEPVYANVDDVEEPDVAAAKRGPTPYVRDPLIVAW